MPNGSSDQIQQPTAMQEAAAGESVESFAARIKSRYPDYAQVADEELTRRIIRRHPEYQTRLSSEAMGKLAGPPGTAAEKQTGFMAGFSGKVPPEQQTGIMAGLGRLASMPGQAVEAFTTPPTPEEAKGFGHPAARPALAAKRMLVDPFLSEANKAADPRLSTVERLGHFGAAAIPLAGPWLSSMAERGASGDISGAATELVGGLAGGELMTPEGMEVASRLGRPASRGAGAVTSALGRGLSKEVSSPIHLGPIRPKASLGALAGGALGYEAGRLAGHPDIGAGIGATIGARAGPGLERAGAALSRLGRPPAPTIPRRPIWEQAAAPATTPAAPAAPAAPTAPTVATEPATAAPPAPPAPSAPPLWATEEGAVADEALAARSPARAREVLRPGEGGPGGGASQRFAPTATEPEPTPEPTTLAAVPPASAVLPPAAAPPSTTIDRLAPPVVSSEDMPAASVAPTPTPAESAAPPAPVVAPGPGLRRLSGPVASEPGYLYHATNEERAGEIAQSGKLDLHRPADYTDQRTWPDGKREKRAYFTPTAEHTWQFAPEEGKPVLLRVKAEGHPFSRESSGDMYTRKPVPASKVEALGEDGEWRQLTAKGAKAAETEAEPVAPAGPSLAGEAGRERPAPTRQALLRRLPEKAKGPAEELSRLLEGGKLGRRGKKP